MDFCGMNSISRIGFSFLFQEIFPVSIPSFPRQNILQDLSRGILLAA